MTLQKYRVLKDDTGLYLVEYKLHNETIYIPARSKDQLNYITGRLDENDPRFLKFLYLNRARLAKNKKKQKRPSPEKIKAMAKKGAGALKKYLSGRSENRVKGWSKYALSNKHIPLVTMKKDYGMGMGFGPAEEGGKDYYTTFMAPVPADGETKVAKGTINVIDFLNIVAGFGEKEYKSAAGRLSKQSKLWAKLLKQVKVKAKSKSRIMDGSLAKDLYRESAAA